MAEPTVLLWDIGGVLLSNGWDETQRAEAARQFGFDLGEFEERHAREAPAYERGELTLNDYLERTLFYTPREFSPAAVRTFIFGCSSARPEVLGIAQELARRSGRTMAALNNEGRELNDHRIQAFGLDRILSLFFSSCVTGRRKPEPGAYRLALGVLRRRPDEVVFVDDRPENLAPARELGMHVIHFQTPAGLREDLQGAGVRW